MTAHQQDTALSTEQRTARAALALLIVQACLTSAFFWWMPSSSGILQLLVFVWLVNFAALTGYAADRAVTWLLADGGPA